MTKFIPPKQGVFLSYYGLSKYQLKSVLRTNGYVPDKDFLHDVPGEESYVYEREGNKVTFARLFYAKHSGWTLQVDIELDPIWVIRQA